jgi:hypothetical protein
MKLPNGVPGAGREFKALPRAVGQEHLVGLKSFGARVARCCLRAPKHCLPPISRNPRIFQLIWSHSIDCRNVRRLHWSERLELEMRFTDVVLRNLLTYPL